MTPENERVLLTHESIRSERTFWPGFGPGAGDDGLRLCRGPISACFLREMATMRDVPPQSHSGLSLSVGTTLVIFGVVVNILAAIKHWRDIRPPGKGERHFKLRPGHSVDRGFLARLVRTTDGDLPSGLGWIIEPR